MEGSIPDLLATALRLASTHLTSSNAPRGTDAEPSRRSRSRCAPGHARQHRLRNPDANRQQPKIGCSTISNRTQSTLTS